MSLLDPVAVSKLETMLVRARVIVEGALSGLHRARLHGSSVEFSEHKEYAPGDEVRHIDWKAYGKLDRYYVKQFEQESELTAHLVLDATGSMAYRGDGLSKVAYASHLLAALAYLLIRQRDRVGLTVFGAGDLRYVPPRARTSHLHDLLGVLDEVTAAGASGADPIGPVLERVAELTRRRRGLVVVASDLFDRRGDALAMLRRLRARGHDVAVFQTLDPHELSLPFSGLTIFEDLESGAELLAEPDAIRTRYRRELNRFVAGVRRECVTGGVEHHLVSTAQPLERSLLDFLMPRVRAAAGGTA
ncbi:MAG: DUF58 domain-containing protein [Deltaproteobacteria bacterium]|nr:MAG: DUF58 domain-containing protein [Deltaproteobacteria bacterium]